VCFLRSLPALAGMARSGRDTVRKARQARFVREDADLYGSVIIEEKEIRGATATCRIKITKEEDDDWTVCARRFSDADCVLSTAA
jgi:hypothetical protein